MFGSALILKTRPSYARETSERNKNMPTESHISLEFYFYHPLQWDVLASREVFLKSRFIFHETPTEFVKISPFVLTAPLSIIKKYETFFSPVYALNECLLLNRISNYTISLAKKFFAHSTIDFYGALYAISIESRESVISEWVQRKVRYGFLIKTHSIEAAASEKRFCQERGQIRIAVVIVASTMKALFFKLTRRISKISFFKVHSKFTL